MSELVIPVEGELECDAQAFDSHNRDRADEGANGDIDQRR